VELPADKMTNSYIFAGSAETALCSVDCSALQQSLLRNSFYLLADDICFGLDTVATKSIKFHTSRLL